MESLKIMQSAIKRYKEKYYLLREIKFVHIVATEW